MGRWPAALFLVACVACSGKTGTEKRAVVLACDSCSSIAGQNVVDFGGVVVGDTVERSIKLKNTGSASAQVSEPSPASPFDCSGCGTQQLPVAGQTELVLRYAPTEAGEAGQVVSVTAAGGASLDIHLRGVGVQNPVECGPSHLDFAAVLVGGKRQMHVSCTNSAAVVVSVAIHPLTQGDAAQFHLISGASTIPLAAGATADIPVEFIPGETGIFASQLDVGSEGKLGLASVTLLGVGVHHLLGVDPVDTTCDDLGFVHPGTSRGQVVTLSNLSLDPLHVNGLDFQGDAGFGVSPSGPFDLAPTGQQGSTVQVTVTFSPPEEGSFTATLHVRSNDPGESVRDVCFSGKGGGPTIDCQPSSMPFGPTALDSPRTRRFTCTNTAVSAPDTVTVPLKISRVSASDPVFSAGIEGSASSWKSGQAFQLAVGFSPSAEASFSGTVTLETNDSAHTSLDLPVSGEGRKLPPCAFHLAPQDELNFGVVAPGTSLTLPVRFTNDGKNDCIVADARITPDSGTGFLVSPSPATGTAVVPAGATLDLPVTFAPAATGAETGKLELAANGSPPVKLPLLGLGKVSCVVMQPLPLDFGLVPPGCSTQERYFELENRCDDAVHVTALSFGEVGASLFALGTDAPALPLLIGQGFRKEIGLVYRPPGPGDSDDSAALYVDLDVEDQPLVEPLTGRALKDARQSETVVQSGRQQVDVLLVLGGSTDLRDAPGEAAFLDFAQQQKIDYHLGITGTDLSTSCPDGRLWPLGGPARFLTPATEPAQWKNYLLGASGCGDGKGLESALEALTPPLVNHDDDPRHPELADGNVGFLRRDAHLSLLFVPSRDDNSPLDVQSYVASLRATKGVRQNNLFSVAALVPPAGSECASNLGSMPRYDAFLKALVGTAVPPAACEPHPSEMEALGLSAFGFQQCFELTNLPVGQSDLSIQVKIDGVVFPAVGSHGERHWTYRTDDEALCFFPLFVPEPGASVTFDYTVACLP